MWAFILFRFTDTHFIEKSLDAGFIKTAYKRNDKWYPAPFGDLKDLPLTEDLQTVCDSLIDSAAAGIIKMKKENKILISYIIQAKPIGMNFHIPKRDTVIKIFDGIPVNFKFYGGYEKKYKNKEEETFDLLDSLRIKTIGKCNWLYKILCLDY